MSEFSNQDTELKVLTFGLNLGCFAHYPNLRQHDATFSRYEKANEWLTTFDTFSATMYSDGDFGLHAYLSYLVVPFYPLFQERGGQRIERDQADWEVRYFTKLYLHATSLFVTEFPTDQNERGDIQNPVSWSSYCEWSPIRSL